MERGSGVRVSRYLSGVLYSLSPTEKLSSGSPSHEEGTVNNASGPNAVSNGK